MPLEAHYAHTSRHIPRFGDLDTQHHVTSRTYETFANEGRFALLAQHGYDFRRIAAEGLFLVPTHSHVHFIRQQMPGNSLRCQTLAFPEDEGRIFWYQRFLEESGNPAAEISTITECRSLDSKQACQLLSPPKTTPQAGDIPDTKLSEQRDRLRDLPPFSESCKRIEHRHIPLFTNRNFNWQYPSGELWRIFEEGRWNMFDVLGIDYDLIRKTDTTAFFMGAEFRYHTPPIANRPLIARLWIERIEKIRMYIRQEVFFEDEPDHPCMSSREFVIFVSASRSRPKRIDATWLELITPYLEFP